MKYLYFLLLLTLPYLSNAQNKVASELTPDARLYEVYEESYVNRLVQENPFLIKRWNYYLDHAFTIETAIPEKTADLPTVQIEDISQINILQLEKEQKIHKSWEVPAQYRIANTDKVLVYQSGKAFNEALRAYLQQ